MQVNQSCNSLWVTCTHSQEKTYVHTYKSFIRPILEYAAPVWCPFQQTQIYQIERIQRNMARFVMNDYSRYSSVTSMLNHLSWPTLANRQAYLKLLLFYKIEKTLVETTISLTPLDSVTRGHSCRYTIPSIRTETFAHSYLPSTTKMWNNLPDSLVMINNLDEFKDKLAHYLL